MLLNEARQLNWIHDLYRLAQSDLRQDKTDVVFERILQHIVQGFNADTGSLALCQEDDDRLTIVAGIGLPAECIGSVITQGSGIIGWVVKNGKPLLLQGDVADDPRFVSPTRRMQTPVPSSALCWPLQLDNRIIGALSVNSLDEQGGYTEEDLEFGGVLVNLITLVIDNARLHHEKQQRIEQTTKMNQQLQTTRHHLEQSKKRLNDTLDSLDSVVWSVTADTFAPFYLNQAAKDVYGYPVADFFNQPGLWLDIIDPADREKVKNCLEQLKNTIVQKITYRIIHVDKKSRWLQTHMRYIPNAQDIPAHFDGITVDITQYKNATGLLKKQNEEIQTTLNKLQEMQQQLLQSEKMASVGQLAAGVAHEINNPIGYINSNLTSLKNYIDNLLALVAIYETAEATCTNTGQLAHIKAFKQKIDLDYLKTDILDLLEESHEGATRVKKIVQDLKDFSHLGGGDDWQWTNLHTGLESTLNIVNSEIKYKAKIVKEFGDLPEVKCLPHQLNQVFMNLLINAAHAIENEGIITLRTGTENDQAWVEISDTGKGIAPEHQSKIFDPFFTTKPIGQGTGLGLSVSYNIIKKHQGEIQLTSQLGQGTTFRIILPISGAIIENV
ncbi:ATP-binding protein [Methylobacter svalbardensis]|uniref:ATP-binding protein n=1 Tax=Methylobacter svalbardensis TaxID=3080016 RepID=UPI0030ED7DC7